MNRQEHDSRRTVYVVDDDLELLDALRWLLESAHLVVETFGSAREFLDTCEPRAQSCLLLDVRMPGMSGLELQQALEARNCDIPIIFLTGHGDVPMAVKSLKSGAFHFLEKPFKDEELLDRIHAAIARDADLCQLKFEQTQASALLSQLTHREQEVMHLLIEGLGNKQIANRLSISEKTVAVHRSNLMVKAKVASLVDLVRLAQIAKSA